MQIRQQGFAHGTAALIYGTVAGNGAVISVGAGLVFGDVNAILPTRILDGENVSLVIQLVQQHRREGFVQVGRYELVLGIERKVSESQLNLLEVVGKKVELTHPGDGLVNARLGKSAHDSTQKTDRRMVRVAVLNRRVLVVSGLSEDDAGTGRFANSRRNAVQVDDLRLFRVTTRVGRVSAQHH